MKKLIFALGLVISASANAQDSKVIPFQGQLADQAGQSLSPSTAATIVFRLYRVPVGGVAIWEESQPNISINAARFSVLLGSRTELPGPTNFNATLYLGLTLDDGNAATADVEMRPRQALVPVISASFAKQAQNADKLNGFDWSALFGVNNPQGNILGSRIASGTITSNEMAPRTVTAAQIAPFTISTGQIAPASIGGEQISLQSITAREIAQSFIDELAPPGTIVAFGGSTVPSGWLLCDGNNYSRTDPKFLRLFNAIGTSWGAFSSADFLVPDLRGLFLRGVDRSVQGRDPDRLNRTNMRPDLGQLGGNTGFAVGSVQSDEFESHDHTTSFYNGREPWERDPPGGFHAAIGASADAYPYSRTNVRGGNETRPKNAYVNYIIKY
jgi:microcystin-dependent protein